MPLICPAAKAKNFFAQGWTGSITLIGLDKSADWRNDLCAGYESRPGAPRRVHLFDVLCSRSPQSPTVHDRLTVRQLQEMRDGLGIGHSAKALVKLHRRGVVPPHVPTELRDAVRARPQFR